jgi:hypothetical protein
LAEYRETAPYPFQTVREGYLRCHSCLLFLLFTDALSAQSRRSIVHIHGVGTSLSSISRNIPHRNFIAHVKSLPQPDNILLGWSDETADSQRQFVPPLPTKWSTMVFSTPCSPMPATHNKYRQKNRFRTRIGPGSGRSPIEWWQKFPNMRHEDERPKTTGFPVAILASASSMRSDAN